MDRNSKIAKNVPKMFQDSRCLTETPRFLDEIPRFPIDRNSKISEIPKPKLDSESGSIFPLLSAKVPHIPSRGNMELFPISSGGGQFTFVPLTLWYKFATRGCRWIPYSNCRSNPSKVQNIFETLFTLDWRM